MIAVSGKGGAPRLGCFVYPGRRPSTTLVADLKRAPLIGEHNVEIFCGELGLSRGELCILAENHVI
jgi:hypothetical protein